MSRLYPWSHYLFNLAVLVTAWITVSVAVERYICVCWPTKASVWCTTSRARFWCVLVMAVMSVLNIPSYLRYETTEVRDPAVNSTKCIQIVTTAHWNQHIDLFRYWTWAQNSFRGIIPVVILIVLNTLIITELRKERVKGKKFSARNRITWMLIVIVFMFLVCVTPDAVLSLLNKGYVEEKNLLIKGT